ncbi:MAG: hypothetical protein KDB82_04935 [Planctomycetes bacterium]|nr:hypothetical protein [Planctomycetota bacterium]
MRTRLILAFACLLLIGGSTLAPSRAQNAPERKADPFPGWNQRVADTKLDFRHYYPLDEVNSTCEMLTQRFPELLSMKEIGRSFQDRPIYCLTLCAQKTGRPETKPAMYIDANIHGNEIQGTEIILVTIWYLLRNYGAEDWVTNLVDTRTFYFVPVVNVDSRYWWFERANNPHSLRQDHRPYDDDRDGRYDEDPPNDLNGDHVITSMRQKDPNGDWVLSEDKRIMVRKKPGQQGEYRVWWSEGIDDDGDGRINEDDLGGVDLNRNFPVGWQPRYRQYGAGEYPCSEPEVRACVDFIKAHDNIAGMQFFHNAARLILRPPGGSSDAGVVPREDIRVYDQLGKRGERILPGYKYAQTHDDLYEAFGSQIDFGYLGLGRFVFTNELWGSTAEEFDGQPGTSPEDVRAWADEFGMGRAYHEWKPFKHPVLGDIEIGGWDQFATRMPPAELFIEEGFRNALFTLRHAESFAELEFVSADATDLGNGLVRVRLALKNKGVMPTDSGMAVQRHEDNPVEVTVEGGELLSAAIANENFSHTTLQKGKADKLRIPRIRSEDIQYAELIVKAKPGAKLALKAHHPRAVDAETEVQGP